ncbi:glycosyltransferase family 2 protein [uncultured Cyclobacterium sp.]|uniref:glycosyltransferase family 2 protein n=1 Tax=uncultured Cyclobacterium sp. TaxID=453820 RepID=UPI0030EC6DCB|tara:strand:- start:5880 stop:6704 length:825 start_codon:yes stop_codon:yes gene_type:complete
MIRIAVLLTCYNRVQSTLKCLNQLFESELPDTFQLDVFLVDDNSPDNTGRCVKEAFPKVNVIEGSGNLFWNHGMHLAWEEAAKINDFDFYFWLNDDTFIFPNAILNIVNDYYSVKKEKLKETIIISTVVDPETHEISYGGRKNGLLLAPIGSPLECDTVNGNFVLIPKEIFHTIGNMNTAFTHGMGDIDYGLRAIEKGFLVNIASKLCGYCANNPKVPWFSSDFTFSQRYDLLFQKTNGNIKEYLHFVRIHKGLPYMFLSFSKTVIRLFFPKLF